MRDTKYAREIATGAHRDFRIERLYIHEVHRPEIRFSWWPEGKFAPRPLDVTEDELLPLFQDAISKGVFTEAFLGQLRESLDLRY
ncbi:MAG: hypothetical protein AB7Q23_17150 [Hyphomonadaceae bacterium]